MTSMRLKWWYGIRTEILWRNDPDGYKNIEEAEKKVLDNKVKIAPQSGRSAFTRNATPS